MDRRLNEYRSLSYQMCLVVGHKKVCYMEAVVFGEVCLLLDSKAECLVCISRRQFSFRAPRIVYVFPLVYVHKDDSTLGN